MTNMYSDGSFISLNVEKAEVLSSTFFKVFTIQDMNNFFTFDMRPIIEPMLDIIITCEVILNNCRISIN